MKESLKYGLLTGLGYCAIVGVIHLVGLCIGYIAGGVDNFLYGETGACWDSMGVIKQCQDLHFRAGGQD